MKNFSRVQVLLSNGAFGVDHYAANLELINPIIPALEYFLSLENVNGFSKKLHSLKTKPLGPRNNNNRAVQWASLCAELGAICLFGNILKIPIVGFDQTSPLALRQNSDCDIVVKVNGQLTFVEVKRNASEDKQLLPELLKEELTKLEENLLFNISAELLKRDYDCSDLDTKFTKIRQHVESFLCGKDRGHRSGQSIPAALSVGDFKVSFFEKNGEKNEISYEYTPDSTSDLKSKLVGPGGNGSNGKPMKPLVDQALEKGAHYLCCRVQKDDQDWREIIGECFDNVTFENQITSFTTDPALQKLRGIVLFSRYDDFCIVNNMSVGSRMWLAGKQ